MLAYPIVGMLDVVLGRAVLEILGAIWMVAAVLAVLSMLGSDVIPADPVQAFIAFTATILLSIGIGLIASLLAMLFETFVTIWALILVLFYIGSGSFFVISFLPQIAISILEWNPVLHCTEWMRRAYYPGYPEQVLDKTYVLSVTIGALVLGLAVERLLRQRLLAN